MIKKVKGLLRILLLFALAGSLLWLSLGNLEVGEGETKAGFILKVWKNANKPFLLLSAVLTFFSHWFRSERWKLLMKPLGYPLKGTHSFFSVMIGYFVNLAIPRGGEISRCYNLYKLNGTPVDQSFGTVVAERIIDLIILLSLISLAFMVQIDELLYFFSQLDLGGGGEKTNWTPYLYAVGGVFLLMIIAAVVAFRLFTYRFKRLIVKARSIISGLKKGLLIVFQLEKRVLFFTYSVGIWVMYFLMSYTIILAFPETQQLSLMDSLTIFVIGGIAMAMPLPGGAGSYHVLVPLGLVLLFNIPREESIAFSFIFHGWQTILLILLGVLSLFGSQYYIRKRIHGNHQ